MVVSISRASGEEDHLVTGASDPKGQGQLAEQDSAIDDTKGRVVCIIGMHRSGTSMVAGLLQRCGLYLGPEDQLLGANSGNPEGHYEHSEFFRIDNALLRHFGGSWDFPPPFKPAWEQDDSLERLRNDAGSLVGTFSGHVPWGWKEPRSTILLPFWRSIVPELRFVICVRSPLEVAKSLAKRNKIPVEQGVFLWQRYMRAAIQDTEHCPRFFVCYEDFFTDPKTETGALLDFCGLKRPSHWSMEESGIRSELRHQKSEMSEILTLDSMPAEYKLLYIGLRSFCGQRRILPVRSDELANDVSEFVRLLDDFRDHQPNMRLQTELAEKNNELFKLRTEMFNDLRANHRWAYRVYRNFIKPFRVR